MFSFFSERINTLLGKSQKIKYVFINTFGSNCTNRCYMCPLRTLSGKNYPMSEETFKKAIAQLQDMDYDGELHFYSQNEPFMDKGIFEKIAYAAEKLPKAELAIISNFTLLDDQKIDNILSSKIKYFSCSVYALLPENYKAICNRDNFERSFINQVKFMKKYAQNPQLSFGLYLMNDKHNQDDIEFCKYVIYTIAPARRIDFYETFSFFNTAHAEKKLHRGYFSPCVSNRIQIVNEGDVSICTIDAALDLKVGNLHDEAIKDLINCKRARRLRQRMLFSNDENAFCNYCDFGKYENIFLYFLPIPQKLRDYLNKKFIPSYRYEHNVLINDKRQIQKKAEILNQIFKDGEEDNWINALNELRRKFYAKEL